MSLWRKLFGVPDGAHDRDVNTYIEESASAETRRVEVLVNKAQEFYPHEDPAKALTLFREAIRLVGPAPASKAAEESRDLTAIGAAFWMAWVCLELLDRPEKETEALLAEARVKSPATAVRIEERSAEANREAACERQSAEALAVLNDASTRDPTHVQDAITALDGAGAWWDLRDAGIALAKEGKYDLAWQTLNSAIEIARAKNGNVPSILIAMGDIRKAQQRHQEAARCYLLSCLSAETEPLKRAVEQLRISLKKAGVADDPAAIRDELLAMRGGEDERTVLARLDSYFSSAGADE